MNTPWRGRRARVNDGAMSNTLQELRQDASKLAHERVIDPGMELAHDAKVAVQNGVEQARTVLKADANEARESLGRLCQQTGRWIAANPFTAVGAALLAGAVMAMAGRSARH